MATTKSSLLSNRASQTSARTPNNRVNERGVLRTINGTMELPASGGSDGDILMLAGVPIDAAILSIKIASDDLDSGTDLSAEVGLYEDEDGDTAKDVDVYAASVTDWRAATAFTEYAFEARDIDENGQLVWEDAGDSTRQDATNEEYFVGVTLTAAGDTAATLSFQITYAE